MEKSGVSSCQSTPKDRNLGLPDERLAGLIRPPRCSRVSSGTEPPSHFAPKVSPALIARSSSIRICCDRHEAARMITWETILLYFHSMPFPVTDKLNK